MPSPAKSSVSGASGRGRVRDAETAFATLIAESCSRGFFGTVSLTLNVQDGCVQQVRVTTDRTIR
jgi:hypothetical protein